MDNVRTDISLSFHYSKESPVADTALPPDESIPTDLTGAGECKSEFVFVWFLNTLRNTQTTLFQHQSVFIGHNLVIFRTDPACYYWARPVLITWSLIVHNCNSQNWEVMRSSSLASPGPYLCLQCAGSKIDVYMFSQPGLLLMSLRTGLNSNVTIRMSEENWTFQPSNVVFTPQSYLSSGEGRRLS